jgi:hypothetical protein
MAIGMAIQMDRLRQCRRRQREAQNQESQGMSHCITTKALVPVFGLIPVPGVNVAAMVFVVGSIW